MSTKPPFTAVEVRRAASGFYEGHSVEIALLSKGIMVALVIWALVWPANANSNLSSLNWSLFCRKLASARWAGRMRRRSFQIFHGFP